MKALIYEGPRQMNLRDVPTPEPGPDDVVVRVAYSGICGSELGGYLGHNALRKPPLIMGHEFSGEIVALGAQATQHNPDLVVGQRVTADPLWYCGRCRPCLTGLQNLCLRRQLLVAHLPGSYAEMVKTHARMVYPLPDHLTLEHAALAEPLACAIRAVRLADCTSFDRVLVVGLGPIGLLILQMLQVSGVAVAFASDTVAERRTMGEHFRARMLNPQADDVVGITRAETGGVGVDVAIDAVGATATRKQCIDAVAPGGRVVYIGLHDEESAVSVNLLIRKELRLQGSFAYTPNDFADALRWLAMDRVRIDPWLLKAPLSQGQACFERLLGSPGPVAKILLDPTQ
jgi:2-desacetyl-2-hydroxyethyl bacteriochlorophyllide A dehydrogenase